MAPVWYRPVDTLLIRRRRPIGEPVPAEAGAGHATHDGTAGAGRILAALLDLGVPLEAVHQLVLDADSSAAELGALDLGRRFERVIVGSHLVNLPDEETRLGFLSVARRHLAANGTLLLEHHPIDWAATAEPTPATPGAALGMVDVRRHPPYVSAVSVYDIGGRVLRQPFKARVLSEQELAAALARVGLAVTRRLGPTWLVAGSRTR
jgi:hypothetical protein